MRILVVEDKKKIGEYIKKGLSENGFNVDVDEEGETGSHLACTENYDLIILDVMLLHRDGWPIVKAMRAKGNQMPVLLLTALDKVEDRVKGLEQGGDDYLVKPFAFSEQLARVRSLLRRGGSRLPDKITFEDLEIDLLRHKAMRSQKLPDLTPKEFSLLTLLGQRTDEVTSRTKSIGPKKNSGRLGTDRANQRPSWQHVSKSLPVFRQSGRIISRASKLFVRERTRFKAPAAPTDEKILRRTELSW